MSIGARLGGVPEDERAQAVDRGSGEEGIATRALRAHAQA